MRRPVIALTVALLTSAAGALTMMPSQKAGEAAQAGERSRTSYTLQGDSLSQMTRRETRSAMHGFKQLSFSAKVGRHYWDGEGKLYRQPLGQVVFFLLGTNDWQSSGAEYRKTIRRILKRIGPERCLVMASLYDQQPITGWNRILFSLARQYGAGRMQVAGWARAVKQKKVRLSDGVHPAGAGDLKTRARLVARSARACQAQQQLP